MVTQGVFLGAFRLRAAAVAALTLAAVLLPVVPANPATDQKKVPAAAQELPADLKLVPADAEFQSLRIADLCKVPQTEKARQLLLACQPMFSKEVARDVGVAMEKIERVTVILQRGQTDAEPVSIVATTGPVNRTAILRALKHEISGDRPGTRVEERKVGDRSYHEVLFQTLKEGPAVYFASDRVFVRGTGKSVRRFLEAETPPAAAGSQARALLRAAWKAPVFIHLTLATLEDMAKEGVPPGLEDLLFLLNAKAGELTAVSSADTRISCRLEFATADAAAAGKKRLENFLSGLRPLLAEVKGQAAKKLKSAELTEREKRTYAHGVRLLNKVSATLPSVQVEQRGRSLQAAVRLPLSAWDLLAVSLGAVALEETQSGEPAPSK
jgi:hypothetical protein